MTPGWAEERDLAERAGSSETTVIRFCRAMGFGGYSELRLTLAAEPKRRRPQAPVRGCAGPSGRRPGGTGTMPR